MALVIEKTIDLTAYEDNPAPKRVEQLSIIHEAADGELVQYYIDPENETEGDKNTYAIGIYHKDTRSYTYNDYDEVVWNEPDERICGNRIERLGVKAFPDVGAIAFYRLKHRNITRIVAPVNPKDKKNTAPTLSAVVNSDGTVTFTLVPPEKPQYACYRIVMLYDIYEEDHITYDLEVTCPAPKISGTYKCFAIGYGKEGQLLSRDSNVLTLELAGESDAFVRPYFMKSEIEEMEQGHKMKRETVRVSMWTALEYPTLFTYSAEVTLSAPVRDDMVIELVNDDIDLFTEYGFSIQSVSGNMVTVYSIGRPTGIVPLTFLLYEVI